VLVFLRGPGDSGVPIYMDWLPLSLHNLMEGRIWTVVTYSFIHDVQAPTHLLFNLIALYFLAPPLQERWGLRGFAHVWLVAVICGALFTVVSEVAGMTPAVTVGMSAGVMGLLAAWTWIYPDATLLLMFVFPVRARWVLPIALGLDGLLFVYGSDLALMAHVGGVAGAWLALRGWTRPTLVKTRLAQYQQRKRRQAAKRRFRVVEGGQSDEIN